MTNIKQRQEYLKTKIQTATPEQLVLLMYDGVLRFVRQGKDALEKDEKDIEAAHIALTRAQQIVLELFYTLDRDQAGELGDSLANLYGYSLQQLVEANLTHDPSKLGSVMKVFENIREGWLGAMENNANAETPATPVPPETVKALDTYDNAATPAPAAETPAPNADNTSEAPAPAPHKTANTPINAYRKQTARLSVQG
jgi:flagellar secretion chaperone FliS